MWCDLGAMKSFIQRRNRRKKPAGYDYVALEFGQYLTASWARLNPQTGRWKLRKVWSADVADE
jgi:hypothetical protein